MNRSCAQPDRTRSGFTLLETVVALALLGLLIGLIAPRLASTSTKAQTQRQLQALTSALAAARVDAMRRAAGVELALTFGEGRCALTGAAGTRVFSPLYAALEAGESDGAPRVIVFDATGRTGAAPLRFALEGDADTMWSLSFDPISGKPALRDTHAHPEEARP